MSQESLILARISDSGRLGCLVSDRYRTVREARIVDILLQSGWSFEVEAGRRIEATGRIGKAIENWIGLGLAYRRGDSGERLFDPVEVLNFMLWAGCLGLDPYWADRNVPKHRALVLDGARALGQPARFSLNFRRRFDLRRFAPGAPVRLRLPAPIAGAYASGVEISPVVPPSLLADVTVGEGRMEVRLGRPRDPIVEIGADISFNAGRPGGGESLEPAERDIYLRPAEGLVRVSPRVQALADSLAGPADEPWETLRSFWNYLIDGFCFGVLHYDQIHAATACEWVLDHGWCDCQVGSALLVSLCRARGIPARIVGGHNLHRLSPMNHFWAEAWINGRGWMPCDLASWNLSRGGRDPVWRDHFFGKIDYRMPTQILPRAFTGPMSVRFPPAWHMIQTGIDGGGGSMEFLKLDGSLIHEDRVILK
jgi:hypothetical protein